MTTDQLLAVLLTVLTGAVLIAVPFANASAAAAPGTSTEAEPDTDTVVQCDLVLLESVPAPGGATVRAGWLHVEAPLSALGQVVRLRL